MINNDMRLYYYFTLGSDNGYGQKILSSEAVGTIKMAINISNQATTDSILFKDATYIGLTQAEVDDTFVIQYGEDRLKVLYVNPKGRYKQVYMSNYD